MKYFAIGNGEKRVQLPESYQAERSPEDGTMIFWMPGDVDIPIRLSVLTIEPKEVGETEAAFWYVINRAKQAEKKVEVIDDRSIHCYSDDDDSSVDDAFKLFFYEVGIGNELIVISVTVDEELEESSKFATIQSDVKAMIESIECRGEEEVFVCELVGSDFDEIAEEVAGVMADDDNETWQNLQQVYDRALEIGDIETALPVGLGFGEMLKRDIPQFEWKLTIDEWGVTRSLNFGDTGIAVFPESMILKRVEDREPLDVKELASNTIDTVEEVFKKQVSS